MDGVALTQWLALILINTLLFPFHFTQVNERSYQSPYLWSPQRANGWLSCLQRLIKSNLKSNDCIYQMTIVVILAKMVRLETSCTPDDKSFRSLLVCMSRSVANMSSKWFDKNDSGSSWALEKQYVPLENDIQDTDKLQLHKSYTSAVVIQLIDWSNR